MYSFYEEDKWEFDIPKFWDFTETIPQQRPSEDWFCELNISGPSFPIVTTRRKKRRRLRIFQSTDSQIENKTNITEKSTIQVSKLDDKSVKQKRKLRIDNYEHNQDNEDEYEDILHNQVASPRKKVMLGNDFWEIDNDTNSNLDHLQDNIHSLTLSSQQTVNELTSQDDLIVELKLDSIYTKVEHTPEPKPSINKDYTSAGENYSHLIEQSSIYSESSLNILKDDIHSPASHQQEPSSNLYPVDEVNSPSNSNKANPIQGDSTRQSILFFEHLAESTEPLITEAIPRHSILGEDYTIHLYPEKSIVEESQPTLPSNIANENIPSNQILNNKEETNFFNEKIINNARQVLEKTKIVLADFKKSESKSQTSSSISISIENNKIKSARAVLKKSQSISKKWLLEH